MKKLTNFSLNDFYDNLDETFFDMEMEFVDKEEYRNAGVPMPNDMLNASNTEKFGLKEKLIKWIKGIKK